MTLNGRYGAFRHLSSWFPFHLGLRTRGLDHARCFIKLLKNFTATLAKNYVEALGRTLCWFLQSQCRWLLFMFKVSSGVPCNATPDLRHYLVGCLPRTLSSYKLMYVEYILQYGEPGGEGVKR